MKDVLIKNMRKLFIIAGIVAIGMIFWVSLGYLMDLSSFRVVLWICIFSIVLFFLTGFIKNYIEHKKFKEFIKEQKNSKEVQEKLQNERIETGDKTGRAKVKATYREQNSGVDWLAANVHGAVAHRKKKRPFLPKNR